MRAVFSLIVWKTVSSTTMSGVLRGLSFASAWVAGDFFAQFYAAHAARLHGKRERQPKGTRPTAQQMYDMLDKHRLLEALAYGIVAYPAVARFHVLLSTVMGPLTHHSVRCIFALAAQQLVMSPLLIVAYCNAMTAWRGGFTDTAFLQAHLPGPHPRYSVWDVEKRILSDVVPLPLLTSWMAYIPVYTMSYFARFRGRALLSHIALVPWLGTLSYKQEHDLL